jgi:hypothetical protein
LPGKEYLAHNLKQSIRIRQLLRASAEGEELLRTGPAVIGYLKNVTPQVLPRNNSNVEVRN